jgi:hypothetical protein
MALADTKKNKNVEQLNTFLRGERAAVDAYRQALARITGGPLRAQLQSCLDSHQKRVEALIVRVTSLGGEASETSGAWGTMMAAIEAGAAAFSEEAAIAALETGEDHGLADYQRDLSKLSAEERGLVFTELLPAQEFTYARMAELRRTLKE